MVTVSVGINGLSMLKLRCPEDARDPASRLVENSPKQAASWGEAHEVSDSGFRACNVPSSRGGTDDESRAAVTEQSSPPASRAASNDND